MLWNDWFRLNTGRYVRSFFCRRKRWPRNCVHVGDTTSTACFVWSFGTSWATNSVYVSENRGQWGGWPWTGLDRNSSRWPFTSARMAGSLVIFAQFSWNKANLPPSVAFVVVSNSAMGGLTKREGRGGFVGRFKTKTDVPAPGFPSSSTSPLGAVLGVSWLVQMPWGGTWKSSIAAFLFLFLLLGAILTRNPLDASLASLSNFFWSHFKNYLSGHKPLHFWDLWKIMILTILPKYSHFKYFFNHINSINLEWK